MKRANRFHKRIIYILGSFNIVPLLNFIAAQQISGGVFAADYEFDIIFDYDVILRVQDSIFYVIFRLLRFLENYTSWNLDIYIKRRRIHDLLSRDRNGVSSTGNKLFTVEKMDFHKLLDMMSQTSKNTDAMKFTCFQSLFRLKASISAL